MQEKINELKKRKEKIEEAGGKDKIEERHAKGKLTARERILHLLDEGTFCEIDAFIEHRCSDFGMEKNKVAGEGVVTGYGKINGRQVCVYAQDFTVIGGSLGQMHAAKICKVQDMAIKLGCPCIGINDSGGARIQEGIDSLRGYGDIFYRNVQASGVIPQICVIMGPCAGGAVYSPALMDFILMTDKTANMFITGPQVVKAVTGEQVSAEELGGAFVHSKTSGVASLMFPDEISTLEGVKKLLSYIPQNNLEDVPLENTNDDPNRNDEELSNILPDSPNKPYDIKEIIKRVVDNGEFFELQPLFATNIVICFARLDGKSVGIIANQPNSMAGVLDINAADKAARFIRFCDSFNIPLVTLVDTAGYLPGVGQEHNGVIRHGAKLLYAYSEATAPKITLIIRKSYGGAYIAMCSKHLGADMVYAWPSAEIAVMGPDGAANIIFKKEIDKAEDPKKMRAEKIEEYKKEFANPYRAAVRGYVDDVIEPEYTRSYLINALHLLVSKRETRLPRKHGNIPL
ncbi:carboxyl transferase domain-containing protein [Brachyspira pilosicoli]|uniref:Propionyl-CoA carboxylase beta chain n=4 Tax=Brachyspira pilosicoli TaxID=52584 RepID=D8ICW2_BRAP9|nr:carboxyl transferase domain-containing protein [Brachyspira pilosicoli]ADK30985.1 acetyl-CoA carboxylase alpha subunit [Brachyspira pilosicoli 95/1000]AGA67201.1 acetyl-CoA carboxylase subunit alpha [Brachyspira pilosicoli P43/6/78]MBW5377285.1 methylmalonyl-CoA carboxyltransferase [Brachyspira pilosicoli]MBW5382842.1 methylmalonyl-CoA carboxyltransferase [Brachyspira pilosicoli]MBW5392607.1 methylmalonyl-CoA carboxyltransferase [Brachyspira pilosicoli]